MQPAVWTAQDTDASLFRAIEIFATDRSSTLCSAGEGGLARVERLELDRKSLKS